MPKGTEHPGQHRYPPVRARVPQSPDPLGLLDRPDRPDRPDRQNLAHPAPGLPAHQSPAPDRRNLAHRAPAHPAPEDRYKAHPADTAEAAPPQRSPGKMRPAHMPPPRTQARSEQGNGTSGKYPSPCQTSFHSGGTPTLLMALSNINRNIRTSSYGFSGLDFQRAVMAFAYKTKDLPGSAPRARRDADH